MIDQDIVEIPADVRDNSPRVVRVVSNGERLSEGVTMSGPMLDHYRAKTSLYSYTMHEWDDVNPAGHRVTYTWFADRYGALVWVYETEYFTRVKCAECEHRYAQRYVITVGQDGRRSDPTPLCGTHVDVTRRAANRMGGTFLLSEPLRIGQHV